jgi:regulator of cell morphogenesis and NO signaling
MFELSSETRVAELHAESPAMLAKLKSTGIFKDGDDAEVTIGDLCWGVGLSPLVILNMLADARQLDVPATIDVSELDDMSLVEVVSNIETLHHDYLRTVLPEIGTLLERVVSAHGDSDERLGKVGALFNKMAGDLEGHLVHEEESLFSMIRDIDQSGEVQPTRCGETVAGPILCMENDHNDMRRELAQLRELTSNYAVPDYACPTYSRMLELLSGFDENTVVHMHKEDSVLFPRAKKAQADLRESGGKH